MKNVEWCYSEDEVVLDFILTSSRSSTAQQVSEVAITMLNSYDTARPTTYSFMAKAGADDNRPLEDNTMPLLSLFVCK